MCDDLKDSGHVCKCGPEIEDVGANVKASKYIPPRPWPQDQKLPFQDVMFNEVIQNTIQRRFWASIDET